ncbi:KAP family P-loop NTPase fold protein [Mariniflexile rhizosphaerae]|uniref:KAP family P-loop NTPase fold protein n=1 Tax=unclassified Mariniflexile TaxID=2643887 RepID=UPI0013C343B0|nr:P-loop NTPase fold protein [Mariniflexile sp. TRM1-10]
MEVLIILSSIFTTVFLLFKIIFHKYQPSFTQKFCFGSVLFLTIFFKNYKDNLPWVYLFDSIFGLEYITYLIFPLFVGSTFFIVIKFCCIVESKFPTSRFLTKTPKNLYASDDPINNEEEDVLSYKPKIDSLISILKNEKNEKSFTIGLVGPWGNGKSSIINIALNRISKTNSDDIVVIHFLPYLNHREEDIINEFFISLSNKLSKYSGKLSNQILDYAKKITDIYKGDNVLDFFDKHIVSFNNGSAKDLYDSINERLKEIDKKIIVFVDDLDRLNGEEISQVLKLIRNTADFRNTVFVVAMDKDYVIKRLKADNNISSTRFIDKFFQLEIYLPAISKKDLRTIVYNKLKDAFLIYNPEFELQLEKGLNHEMNLFDDYIKNIRDAKRLVNQIIYDFQFLKEEINFKDFMNFTYFKLKFPKFMELLNHNTLDFLENDNGEYRLKIKENNETENKLTKHDVLDLIALGNVKHNDYTFLENYSINLLLTPNEDCLKKTLGIDCEDELLLSKTLAYLFGNENKVESFNSIRKDNNFHMLMQQKVFKNVFIEKEFQTLIQEDDFNIRQDLIKKIFQEGKIPQLFNRLDYFNSDNQEIQRNIVLILLNIQNNIKEFKVNEQEVLNKIAVYVEKQISKDGNADNYGIIAWLKANIFEGENLSIENKVLIIGELWESKTETNLWEIDEDYIAENAIILFEKYLSSFDDNLWNVNDYSFYKYYHLLKNINGIKEEINYIIIEFWKKNNIELLCAQSTDTPAFSLSSFKISDFVSEIFKSKIQFHDFVINHSENPPDAVKEFLELFALHQITSYNLPIVYNFEHSKLMLERLSFNVNSRNRSFYDENEKFLQIVFETNLEGLISTIIDARNARDNYELISSSYPEIKITSKDLALFQFSSFSFKEKYYLFVSYDKEYRLGHAIEILKAFEAISILMYGSNKINFRPYRTRISNRVKIKILDDKYLQVISIQRANTIKLNAQ